MSETTAQTRTAGRNRVAVQEAIRRLAEKRVPPAYHGPRGNQETHREDLKRSMERFQSVLGR
jgi:hypothetical protein